MKISYPRIILGVGRGKYSREMEVGGGTAKRSKVVLDWR
jgi:hypothetical protein